MAEPVGEVLESTKRGHRKLCVECGSMFWAKRPHARYCTPVCRQDLRQAMFLVTRTALVDLPRFPGFPVPWGRDYRRWLEGK